MQEYHARAKRGIKLLLGRQVLLQIVSLLAGVVVARVLHPSDVGLYIVSASLVGIFAMFADFGLAPSFIQRKAELTDNDLQVGFTLQQILTSFLVAVLLLVGGLIARTVYPNMPEVVWLLRVLSFNLYLTSWRSMSALQLERHLKYEPLARIEVIETLVYHGVTVGLALFGLGVWSFTIAVLVQGILGAGLTYMASPWPVRFRLERKTVWELVRYGVPFQFQSVMNSFSSWITTIVVGRVVGPTAIGYLTWASSNGRKPLMITSSVMRVAFPHFSRIQNNLPEVERIITRYLTGMLLVAGYWFVGIVVTCPAAIELIYTRKWVPATPALMLYAGALFLDMASWVLGVSLNSIGRLGFCTKVVIGRSILNLALTLLLIYLIRNEQAYNGVAVAYLVSSILVVPLLLRGLGQGAGVRVGRALMWLIVPIVLAVGAGLLAGWMLQGLHLLLRVIVPGIAASVVFFVAAWQASPDWTRAKIIQRLRQFRPDKPEAGTPVAPGR